MATVKIAIPLGGKDSKAFRDALKVTIAATAYNANVKWAKATDGKLTLEPTNGKWTSNDANSIVRYLYETSTKKTATWVDLSFMEWETRLESILKSDGALEEADSKIKQVKPEISTSPTSIVIFSTLYDVLSSAKLSDFPAVKEFLIRFLETDFAKTGIELATAHTTEKKLDTSTVPGASAASNKPSAPAAQHLRPGIYANKIDGKKIMPVPGEKNILITSALPYVNNVPHLGNIIGSVLSADVFSRYCKVRNINSLYVCGTDEYGTAIETKAIEEGASPQEICDKYYQIHTDIYRWFDIGFDYFGRSATPKQTEITQAIFMGLYNNNYIEQKSELQLFCPKHERFLADRFVEGICPVCAYPDARGDQCDKCGSLLDPMQLGEPRCKIDGATPVPRETTHCYIRLDLLQPKVEEFVAQKSTTWSSNAVAITQSWLKQGLNSRSITRDLKWGVPVPLDGFQDKVFYVWFDAPIGYISITANYTDAGVEGGQEWKRWWLPKDDTNVKLYQFMGKDNVPFHTVLFPASLLGTGENWTKLHQISTTEYLQYEGDKFSKSRGVGVFGDQAKFTGQSSSVFRYYLLSSRPETSDSQFLWREFITKHNTELLNNLGNLVNRVTKFLASKYHSIVPDYTKVTSDTAGTKKLEEIINDKLKEYVKQMDRLKLKEGMKLAMDISMQLNSFLQENKLDNSLFSNFPDRCAATIGAAVNGIYLLSALLSPFIPATSDSIDEQINAPRLAVPDSWRVGDILPGHAIGKPAYLFKRIDEGEEEEWKSKFGGSSR